MRGEAAWGIHTLANANMERAMRIVSIERGRDPRKYALVAFGGAGPLHAARLALALGIPKIVVPFGAGVGSAIGMLEADSKLDASMTHVLKLTAGAESRIADIYGQLQARLDGDLQRMGSAVAPSFVRFAYLRYAGQGHEIRVDLPDFPVRSDYAAQITARFEEAYQKKYGYRQAGALVEAVDWYVVATVANATKGAHRAKSWKGQASAHFRRGTRKAYLPELRGYVDCAVIDRSALPVGEVIAGRRSSRKPRPPPCCRPAAPPP